MKVLKEHKNTQITQKCNNRTDIQKNSKSPSLHKYWVTRGRLPQRAGLPSLNGGETATAVPPKRM